MREVKEFIDEHLKERLPSLGELSKMFDTTPSTLKRKFKRRYGESIYNYFLTRKMKLAEEMLQTARMVQDVCYELGYENLSHFAMNFKRHTGKYPKEYIKVNTSHNG